MAKLGPQQKALLKALEGIRAEYETAIDDESIKSLPREMKRIHDKFDELLQKLEDGEFEDEDEEEEDDE